MNEKFYSLPKEKQQRIIQAGYRVFGGGSYKKCPVGEIAREAGISKSLLFYYFKNNFQKIFAYLKNFIIYTYIIYYQKFLSNFHSLTPRGPKLPARCPLYNTCMITG